MITPNQKSVLLGALEPLLSRTRAEGRAQIAAQNQAAIEATGKPQFAAGPLATMAWWPRLVGVARHDTGLEVELVSGPEGRLWGFARGQPTDYVTHRAGWAALREELEIIREITGVASDEEAHALLPEIHGDFSYGVVVMPLRMIEAELHTAVAIRSQAVGSNQGTLTLLGGFVHPGETLFRAAERQIAAEGHLKVRFRGWAAWGPHNAAQSATFVLPADPVEEALDATPPDAWEFEGKTFTWVPLREFLGLLLFPKEQDWFLRHFAGLGLTRREIVVAPDIVRPTLHVIAGLNFPRDERGLFLAK